MRWKMVLLGAGVGGGLVLGYMLWRTKKELDQKARLFRLQLESEEGQAIVTQQMTQMRADLGTFAERVANKAADDHIGTTYGLTPARMHAVEGLMRQYGIR